MVIYSGRKFVHSQFGGEINEGRLGLHSGSTPWLRMQGACGARPATHRVLPPVSCWKTLFKGVWVHLKALCSDGGVQLEAGVLLVPGGAEGCTLCVCACTGFSFPRHAVQHGGCAPCHWGTWALHTEAIVVQWAAGGAGKLQAGTDSILLPVPWSISVCTAAVSQHQLGKQQVVPPQ